MYNRYIPQPDGSYQRNRVQDPPAEPQQQPPCDAPPFTQASDCYNGSHSAIPGFLKQLLPKDLDTGDLMIILLLLLMAGDKEENKQTALLTLALYFLL